MFRQSIFKNQAGEGQLRGTEVRRIEAFSDAVFAFAVTLLIVSLEVPKNFDELIATIRGFFAFGISFALLMSIWYEQNLFFRRYGLDDIITIVLNCTLIFLVLFYVYPLKFLFTLLLDKQLFEGANTSPAIGVQNVPTLMEIYGAGFISIYFLFYLMYLHAKRKRHELNLISEELFDTRTRIYKCFVFMSVGAFSVILAWLLPPGMAGFSGFAYFLIGPGLTVLFSYRTKRKNKLFHR